MENSSGCHRLIPVQDQALLRACGIFKTPRTLRKEHCQKRHLGLFVKIDGRLYVDLDHWDRLVAAAKKRTEDEAKRLQGRDLTD